MNASAQDAGKIARDRLPGRVALARIVVALQRREQALQQRSAEMAKPDLEDILAEQPPRLLRGPHYVVVALLLLLILVASLVKVDMIVAASGRLVPDGPPIVLQPLERSIIREIRVKVGDTVRKGEVLATLDPTFAQADRASLATRQSALRAQIRRLQAELEDTPLAAGDGTPEELLQLTLYHQRQSQYASRLDGLDEEIKRDQTAIRTAGDSRDLLSQQLGLAREIEAMRAQLLQTQTGSRLNYLDAQAARVRAEREYQELLNRTVELQHTLLAARAARQVFIDEWRGGMLEELVRTRSDLSAVTENLAKAARVNDLVELSAPQDGIVLDVARRSVGSVLHEAEPLVTLIPLDTPLIAEVMIESGDVGYPKLGDAVAVKVNAFPYQRHGMLEGRLRSIGEDSFSGLTGPAGAADSSAAPAAGAYHRSQVTFTSTGLHDLPEGSHLIPGMTVSAEIKVGTRSLLSYLLYPLRRGLNESFREP
jgi:HlyD family secretion protein